MVFSALVYAGEASSCFSFCATRVATGKESTCRPLVPMTAQGIRLSPNPFACLDAVPWKGWPLLWSLALAGYCTWGVQTLDTLQRLPCCWTSCGTGWGPASSRLLAVFPADQKVPCVYPDCHGWPVLHTEF